MNEIEKICKEIQCPHFIVWNFGYGDCISCKLQGKAARESYNIESVADDCPYKDKFNKLKK
uniref:hypothetical protein n=1 Tax=Segatella hominis TaxID=2518605 RepID=UPI004026754F